LALLIKSHLNCWREEEIESSISVSSPLLKVPKSLTSTFTERGTLTLPDFNKFGPGDVDLLRLSITDMKSFIEKTSPELLNGLDRRNAAVKFLAAFKGFVKS